jgi:nucleoside-diphosphate-sugar epimerase
MIAPALKTKPTEVQSNNTVIIGGNGYIGSALREHIKADVIDLLDISKWRTCRWDVDNYDTIILLAGHSSMPMGRDDPTGAWYNNVENFKRLLDNLRDDQRLIYASSGSVYNGIKSNPDENCTEFHPMNMYDLTKYVIDQLATLADKHTYGLRFVTVNGYSPTLRIDLMLNKMAEDAKNKGVVTIKNASLTRPLLGIQDLCRAIKTIVNSSQDFRGIYNLCSFNGHTIEEYARAVTEKFGGVVEDLGDEPHYVYGADTTKFQEVYNFHFEETLDSILESLDKEPLRKVIRDASFLNNN